MAFQPHRCSPQGAGSWALRVGVGGMAVSISETAALAFAILGGRDLAVGVGDRCRPGHYFCLRSDCQLGDRIPWVRVCLGARVWPHVCMS